MKISTKKTEVFCFSRNPTQCTLHISGYPPQQVENSSTWDGICECRKAEQGD